MSPEIFLSAFIYLLVGILVVLIILRLAEVLLAAFGTPIPGIWMQVIRLLLLLVLVFWVFQYFYHGGQPFWGGHSRHS